MLKCSISTRASGFVNAWDVRAEDSGTVAGQLAKELHNAPGGLRIEATRRLVEEHQEFRLGENIRHCAQ